MNSLDFVFQGSQVFIFVSTEKSKTNLINIGIKKNIHVVGSLSLSKINLKKEIAKNNFFNEPFILFTFHPISDQKKNIIEVNEVFKSINILAKKYKFLITSPNQDIGNEIIFYKIKELQKKFTNNVSYIENLGSKNYFSAINNCLFVMGNSSSGIIEVASYNKYFLNIGERQQGREKSMNTIDTIAKNNIINGINKVLSKIKNKNTFKNIYYKKNTIGLILKKLPNIQ